MNIHVGTRRRGRRAAAEADPLDGTSFASMRIAAVTAAALLAASCRPAPAFHEVTVSGNEYFFTAPDTLDPGLTAFAFDNHGLRRHEMGLTLLQPGVSLSDVAKPESLAAPDESLYGPDAGILLAKPRERPPGRILVDLLPGRTYLLWCDFRDSTGATRHSDLGMIRTLVVRGPPLVPPN